MSWPDVVLILGLTLNFTIIYCVTAWRQTYEGYEGPRRGGETPTDSQEPGSRHGIE